MQLNTSILTPAEALVAVIQPESTSSLAVSNTGTEPIDFILERREALNSKEALHAAHSSHSSHHSHSSHCSSR